MNSSLLILLFMNAALAVDGSTSLDMYEKTFGRANSYCALKNHRIEIMIKGGSKFTEVKERGYGEYTFYKVEEKVEIFNFSKSQSTLYHFLKGKSSICSKSTGYLIEGDKAALLFGEEYRPHGSKLLVQVFDFKKMIPLETVHTNLIVEKSYARPGGFIFKSHPERFDGDMGTVNLRNEKYTYQDRIFPVWMNYSNRGVVLDPESTYKKLPWRKYFNDQAEFFKASGFDASKKAFTNNLAYFAVKFPENKRCILFTNLKKTFDGTEDWHCLQAK